MPFKNSVKVPSQRCPKCGQINDGAAALDLKQVSPKEGDISFCIVCGSINTFSSTLELVQPSSEKLAVLLRNPWVIKAQRAFAAMNNSN